MDYFLIAAPRDKKYCKLGGPPKSMANWGRPRRGDSMKGSYTEAQEFKMDAKHPGLAVPDVLANNINYLVVSGRFKDVLEAKTGGVVTEYLPIVLLNHKGRPVPGTFYVVNVVGTVDCADKSRSEGSATDIHPGEFYMAKRLHLLPAKIPPELTMFRTALFPGGIWIREDVKQALQAIKVEARFIAEGEDIY
jgi:hypothetical protein